MPIVVVGGESRKIGKSSLVCALISCYVRLNWTAVKVTSHRHQPENCLLVEAADGWSAWQQMSVLGDGHPSDTLRFLRAGAKLSLLVQAEERALADAAAFIRRFTGGHLAIESTRIAEHLRPDCFLMMIGATKSGAKHSSRQLMSMTDAFISTADFESCPERKLLGKPLFRMHSHGEPENALWDFLSERLSASA